MLAGSDILTMLIAPADHGSAFIDVGPKTVCVE